MTNCHICKKELGASEDTYNSTFLNDVQLQEKLRNQTGMGGNDVICYDCAKRVEKKLKENTKMNLADVKIKPTPLLWLIPVFMGLLGGILMYIAVKDEDQAKANSAVLVGLVSTVTMIIAYVLIVMGVVMHSGRNMMGF